METTRKQPLLTLADVEKILLQNQLDFVNRWLLVSRKTFTSEAHDYLEMLADYLETRLNPSKGRAA